MTTIKMNREKRQVTEQKLMDGLKKHQASMPTWTIGGTSRSVADLQAMMQERLTALANVDTAHAAWLAAVAAARDTRARTDATVMALKQSVRVSLPGTPDVLADFGLTPRKPRVVTPEKAVKAVAKRKATREARNTMGPKQRLDVKGNVETTIVTEPTVTTKAPPPTPPTTTPPATPHTS